MSDVGKQVATANGPCVDIGDIGIVDVYGAWRSNPVEVSETIAARLALAWNVLADAEVLAKAVVEQCDEQEKEQWYQARILDSTECLARDLLAKLAAKDVDHTGTTQKKSDGR